MVETTFQVPELSLQLAHEVPISGPTLSKQSKFDNGPYWNLVAHHQAVISLHESSIYGTWYKILGPMLYKAITQ